MSFAKRFIGAETLPTRLSDFDVQQSFCLSADDIAAVAERFRHDRRVAAAIQMLFLRGPDAARIFHHGATARRPQEALP